MNSLGESARQSVYFYIKNKFKVSRDKIPEKLVELQGGLEKIFGAGAQFIARALHICSRGFLQKGQILMTCTFLKG
jgi:hypothetical protein